MVAAEEEEDDVPHRGDRRPLGAVDHAVHDAPAQRPEDFQKAEPAFRDIQQYLLSLEPPKYPFPIDRRRPRRGEAVFTDNCAKCHGTYGEKWTYPNKVIPLDEIGTDPNRLRRHRAEVRRRLQRQLVRARSRRAGSSTASRSG